MAKRYYLDSLAQNNKAQWVPSLVMSSEYIDQSAAGNISGLSVVTGDTSIDPNTGQPVDMDCLLCLNARNHAIFASLAGVDLLPDFPLDSKVGSMHAATKQAMKARLLARGVPASITDNADGFRDIIEHVAKVKLNNAGFSADNFDA